jgi:Tol biopolymer transport system component
MGLRLAPEAPQISPDGRYVAVAGGQSGETNRIWIRPLDAAAFRPLAGTEEAGGVFWAADSRALGFLAAGTRTLKRVSVAGGSPQTLYALGQTEFPVGASWNRTGLLLFSKASASEAAIFSLSSPGQTPTAVTPRGASSTELYFYPQWLPDHRRFLFVIGGDPRTSGLYMSSIDDPSRRERILPDTNPAVVRNGQLLFVRSGTLFAQPVDARMRPAGEPAPVAENAGAFSVSDAGTVVYLPARSPDMQLTWVARNGRTMAPFGDPKPYRQLSLSSHGQVAAEIEGSPGGGIWALDARGVASRVAGSSSDPVWSPDRTEISFAAGSERRGVFRQALGSRQAKQMLSDQGRRQFPKSWSAADDALLYLVVTGKSTEIWRTPAGGHGAPEPLVRNGFWNDQPEVSPDGRWLAYISNESGMIDVYVAPYRRPDARVRVSPAGGGQPTWRGDSKELFYISANNHLLSVAIGPAASAGALSTESAPQVGTPTSLFEVAPANPELDTYAPAPDGQKFLVMPGRRCPHRASRGTGELERTRSRSSELRVVGLST